VIANTCGCYMFNLFNGIPVKEYHGDKTDISFFSLTRYLRQIKDVADVRAKISEEFYALLNLPPAITNLHMGIGQSSAGAHNLISAIGQGGGTYQTSVFNQSFQ
jgi:hypothetical protein